MFIKKNNFKNLLFNNKNLLDLLNWKKNKSNKNL